jgi:Family of unknown function (DUF6370)
MINNPSKAFKKLSLQKQKIMKAILTILTVLFFTVAANAQTKNLNIHKVDPSKKIQVVEAACGECQYKMEGKSCDLAVRIDGKSYFVDGTSIDEHGNAHADDGFCNAVRKAEVQGEIKDNRFVATYFKLIETPAKKKTKKS